jgi:hypothetical protein
MKMVMIGCTEDNMKASDNQWPKLLFQELGSEPASPDAGLLKIYARSDHSLYVKDSTGTVTELGAGGGGGIGDIGARVYNSTAQSVANTTPLKLSFNTERFDTSDFHSTSVNPERLTAPATGTYIVTAHVAFDSNGTGYRQIFLMKNETEYIAVQDTNARSAGGTEMSIMTIIRLSASDFVTCHVSQNSGGSLNIAAGDASPSWYNCDFAIQRIA